jgi:hypothetical protein
MTQRDAFFDQLHEENTKDASRLEFEIRSLTYELRRLDHAHRVERERITRKLDKRVADLKALRRVA